MAEAENQALPGAANDSWRTWLMTGSRRTPVDRRRLRGAHRGLKKMLIEGMTNGGAKPHAWKEFSGAMIRHAVDEALGALPSQDKQLVKLAYFGGLSNREIAENIGMTEATVQRRLRRAIDAISEYIERGRSFGRRAFYALTLWLCGRWIGDTAHQALQAAAVMSAAVIIVAQPAAPAGHAAPPPKPIRIHTMSAPGAPVAAPAALTTRDQVAPPKPTPALPDAKVAPPRVSLPQVQPPSIDLPVTPPSIPAISPLLPNVRPPA
jgi:RNA polymerase sigma factor (sigma-70 family)